MSGGDKGIGESCRLGHPTLGQVLGASAASAEFDYGFFQQRTHVVGLAGGLSEDKRGLWRLGGEERGHGWRLAGQCLGQQLEKIEVAAGESAHDQLAAVALGSLREQGCGLRRGLFFPR